MANRLSQPLFGCQYKNNDLAHILAQADEDKSTAKFVHLDEQTFVHILTMYPHSQIN